MTARPVSRTCVRLTAAVLALVACSPAAGPEDGSGPTAPTPGAGSQAPALPSPVTAPTDQEVLMRIQITVNGRSFSATLADSAAAGALLAQLPLSVPMTDHGGVEKTGRLPLPLSLQGQPEGADPDVGDVGYYAPGQDLVLYYGDQSYYDGIVVLGRMADDAAQWLADVDGPVTATIEVFDG
jgi:hypothetical protein